MKGKYKIGIDEVGRGPIAGPVAVGSFIFIHPLAAKFFKGVKESKQLTEEKREEWFLKIEEARKKGLIHFAVHFQSEKIIDTKGLSFAIKNALDKSLTSVVSLTEISTGFSTRPTEMTVLLDGGLKAPAHYTHQKTIIKGDVKEKVIALASICAKVLRDRKMRKWSVKYPNYGFEIHKGYGTQKHYEAIKKHGLTPLHRRSFLKKLA